MFEGAVCETSLDCGPLKCIERRCQDPYAPPSTTPTSIATIGLRAMFGTAQRNVLLVALLDIAATSVEPFILLTASSNSGEPQTLLGILCFVPVGLTGSTIHFAHGRVVPGIISFFGWTAAAASTFAIAGLSGYALNSGPGFNDDAAWAVGLVVGSIFAASLTTLDVWMARVVSKQTRTPGFAPAVVPMRGGALATFGGSF
jgi:hypothetical protein